jgi:hypothetical protein
VTAILAPRHRHRSIDIGHKLRYIASHLAQGRALLETIPEVEQGAMPAGGSRDPAPGRLWDPAGPALRPVREELAELGQVDLG